MGNYAIAITGGSTTKSHRVHPKLNSFAEVQAAVRAGRAKDYFDIGQELRTHYTRNGSVYFMPWVVLDNNRECVWPDGSRHPGLWIGSKYATIEELQFDAPEKVDIVLAEEPNALEGWYYWGVDNRNQPEKIEVDPGAALPTTYVSYYRCLMDSNWIATCGYGRYLHCAIRQWLNSDGAAGEWWTAQHLGDKPPTQLDSICGFMCGLDQDFLAVINPVKIQVAANTVFDGGITDIMYDRFFLQSIEELYGQPREDAVGIDGPFFPYWKEVTGLDAPSKNGKIGAETVYNDARKICTITSRQAGVSADIALRSAWNNVAGFADYIDKTGYMGRSTANSNYHALPAACIS